MPILNYTNQIKVQKTSGEIQVTLAAAGHAAVVPS